MRRAGVVGSFLEEGISWERTLIYRPEVGDFVWTGWDCDAAGIFVVWSHALCSLVSALGPALPERESF